VVLATLAVATIAAAAEQPSPVTFTRDVLPILQKHCQSCHRPGQVAPMSLVTYEEARPWARAIKVAVAQKKMPPWFADARYGHFTNDRTLGETDIDTLAKWADTGAPRGDARDAPAPIHWPGNGWGIQPEVVVDMPPHEGPSNGILELHTISLPPRF